MKKEYIIILIGILVSIHLNAQPAPEQPSNYLEPDAGTESNPYLISNIANLFMR